MPQDLTAIQAQLAQLEGEMAQMQQQLRMHRHDGNLASRTNLNDIFGLFEVVSVAPTLTPTSAYDQIKIYTNGTVYRLYWYDYVGHAWHYILATA